MVGARGQGTAARMVELRGVQPRFPFYGTMVLRAALRSRTTCCADHGALVRPELLTQLGIAVGRPLIVGGQPFTIRGVISQEPGRRVGASASARACSSTTTTCCATGLLAFGSRASYQILLAGERATASSRSCAIFGSEFRDGSSTALLRIDRGSHRRRSRARRELPEPRRLRDPGARRDRRLERHARLRAPEDQERRDPEVRRRDDAPGPGDLRPAGGVARSGGERARSGPRGARHCGHSGADGAAFGAAPTG